jgi:hypothetical protein
LYSKNKAIKKSARFFGALVYLKAHIWKGAYQDTRALLNVIAPCIGSRGAA